MEGLNLSPEQYALIGAVVTANLGLIWKAVSKYFKRDTDYALLSQRLDFVIETMGEIKARQEKLSGDVNAAFLKLRERDAKSARRD